MTYYSNHVKIILPSFDGNIIMKRCVLNSIKDQIRVKKLLLIKRLVDADINGDCFTIINRRKNIDFNEYEIDMYGYPIRFYCVLDINGVKNIIRRLSIEDCYMGPTDDRDGYDGFIFIFTPMYKDIKLYIKIRVENNDKNSVCISIHEFGLYDKED